MTERSGNREAAFVRQNSRAVREAREAERTEPRACSIRYDPQSEVILVGLHGGFLFGFPPAAVPGLEEAGPAELSEGRVSPSGDGLKWDQLGVHASLGGLINEALNLREWAPRIMGQIRSEAKARAARKNGLKGGRPRSDRGVGKGAGGEGA
jgi:hypothetical protein